MTGISIWSSLVAAVVMSELAFDADATAYWRRWLGWFGYSWRRLSLTAVPAALAVVLCQAAPSSGNTIQQILAGAAAGAGAAVLLRADTRTHIVGGHRDSETNQAASALTWIYRQARERFDSTARRRVDTFTAALRREAPPRPERLIAIAEEIEGAFIRDLGTASSVKEQRPLERRLATLREWMDLLVDPLADERDRRRASAALSELVAEEIVVRRWSRPAPQGLSKERQ